MASNKHVNSDERKKYRTIYSGALEKAKRTDRHETTTALKKGNWDETSTTDTTFRRKSQSEINRAI